MLTVAQGTALYVGAVLGTGIIALPAFAADIAGPASLLAWLGLALLSAPLAATFAALGSRYPDAGGVATYARLAFGERAAAVVGWCFYFTVPVGAPAAALWAGSYVAEATDGTATTTAVAAVALMVAVPVTNWFGVRLTGRVQLGLGGLLVTFLIAAVAFSLPEATLDNLHPFAPHGWHAIGPAAALLVWSLVGWEAVTYLTAEFRRPQRDLPRATAAAVAAVLLVMGTMNAYYAGAGKLGAALGRDGAFPGWLSRGSLAGAVPRRSLAVLGVMGLTALCVDIAMGVDSRPLVMLATGLFALAAVVVLLVMTGIYLLWPLVVAGTCLLYRGAVQLKRPSS